MPLQPPQNVAKVEYRRRGAGRFSVSNEIMCERRSSLFVIQHRQSDSPATQKHQHLHKIFPVQTAQSGAI